MPKPIYEEHPLFPAEDDEDPKPVEFIQVMRHENGKCLLVPRTFRADELRSIEDIAALYGGGHYELQARGASVKTPGGLGRLSANRRYQIAGVSRPLTTDEHAPREVGGVPTTGPVAAAPSSSTTAAAPAGEMSMMQMFMQWQMQAQQQAAAREERDAERRREEDNRRRDEEARRDDRRREEDARREDRAAAAQRDHTTLTMNLLTTVLGRAGGGADEFSKMANVVLKLKGGAPIDDEAKSPDMLGQLTEIAQGVADTVQGAVRLKEMGGLMPTGNGVAVAAPAGSAASVLGVSPLRPGGAG